MTNITVQPNQSMIDVIIQATGSVEAGMQFCMDNDVALSDTPVVGTVYVVSSTALALGDAGTLAYLAANGIVIGTLGAALAMGTLLTDEGGIGLTDEGGVGLEMD